MKRFFIFLLFVALLSFSVSSLELPQSIKNLQEAVRLDAVTNLRNVSFAIAFLAGILSIFSPCTVAILPAFMSYAFKEKKEITKMTSVFFLGFSSSFIVLGLLIAYLQKISFVYFQNDSAVLIQAIGVLLVIFGLITILGKGFTFLNFGIKPRHDVPGIFIFGALFAVGWSACSGPVIAGILSIAAILDSYVYSAFLLFFYSLGIAIPLFILSFFYDRYNFSENRLVKGKSIRFSLFGNEFDIHSTNAVSGLLLLAIGILFIFFKGTTVLTTADLFGRLLVFLALLAISIVIYRFAIKKVFRSDNSRHLSYLFLFISIVFLFFYIDSHFVLTTIGYSEYLDRILLQNVSLFNSIGMAALLVFGFFFWKMLHRKK